jgi:hypothetical protein
VVSFTPSRRATDARESSLDNASATASRRNSSGYLDGRPNKGSLPWPHGQNQVSTTAGQPHGVRAAQNDAARIGYALDVGRTVNV